MSKQAQVSLSKPIDDLLRSHDVRISQPREHVLPLVNKYSSGRFGVNPGSAIGLLEAVLNRADFSGQRCVGPDDVFHLVRHADHS